MVLFGEVLDRKVHNETRCPDERQEPRYLALVIPELGESPGSAYSSSDIVESLGQYVSLT